MMLSYLTYWREALIALLIISWMSTTWWLEDTIAERDATIATMTAEATLGVMQQDALRKAIIDQSEAVEAQRIDAEKRAERFEASSRDIRAKYEVKRREVARLSGDDECQAMRSMIQEAVK